MNICIYLCVYIYIYIYIYIHIYRNLKNTEKVYKPLPAPDKLSKMLRDAPKAEKVGMALYGMQVYMYVYICTFIYIFRYIYIHINMNE
jgi:hypothetical protein